jgi:hypothetical protein
MRELEKGKKEVEDLTGKVLEDSSLVPVLIEGVKSSKARVRFGSAKVLRRLSEMSPKMLYPYWSHFEDRLSGDNIFLRSDALCVLVNLAGVDSHGRIEKVFDKLFSQLDDESMILAANLAGISGKLALAKPNLQTKIVNRLTRVDDTGHSRECKNIIKGKVIESLGEFYGKASAANRKKILAFVKKELGNRRTGTRRKAERFVSRHGSPK